MVARVPEVALSYRPLTGDPSAASRYAAFAKETMSWSTIQERWEEYKVAAKRQWDKLSEQQLHGTRGNREYLSKRVQDAYSLTAEEAEREISAWQARMLAGKAAAR